MCGAATVTMLESRNAMPLATMLAARAPRPAREEKARTMTRA